jgi:hypothetical protein
MECHDHRKSSGACCHASPYLWDLAQSAAPKNCSHRTAIDHRTRPVDLAITGKPIQEYEMDQLPNSVLLPVALPPPAAHTGAAAQSLRQHPPGNTAAEHENDAREASAVCQARSPTLRLGRRNWQKRFDQIPQPIWNERASHVKDPQEQ